MCWLSNSRYVNTIQNKNTFVCFASFDLISNNSFKTLKSSHVAFFSQWHISNAWMWPQHWTSSLCVYSEPSAGQQMQVLTVHTGLDRQMHIKWKMSSSVFGSTTKPSHKTDADWQNKWLLLSTFNPFSFMSGSVTYCFCLIIYVNEPLHMYEHSSASVTEWCHNG